MLSLLLHFTLLTLSSIRAQQEGVERALRRLRDSVDRFEANFQRAVDGHGQADSVREMLEERAMRFRLDDQSSVDFPAAVLQAEIRLQEFFDSKMAALRRLVRTTENAARLVDVDAELPATLSAKDCLEHLGRLDAVSLQNRTKWMGDGGEGGQRAQPHRSTAGVHVALESYKCSGSVRRDFDWTGHARLEEAMERNARQDPAIFRQYLGTYSGLTRLFPGFYWDIGPEQFSVDLFDPRLRPWFVAAESAPRDVLFLLDFSGSAKGQTAHLIKTSVMAVLQTLQPNDFFAGIWYNSRRERVLANCSQPGEPFIAASSRNKLLFRRFLDRVEERDQASLPAALEMGFAQFLREDGGKSEGKNNGDGGGTSGGHRLILLFTDGIEFWPTEVVQRFQQENPDAHIRVFGHSVGLGRGPQPALAWLTCQTRAGLAQTVIGSVSEIRLKAKEHLAKLNELLALAYRDKAVDPDSRPVSWPIPYMDAQRGGPLLSLSMPVLGPQPGIYGDPENRINQQKLRERLDGFMGVAALDIRFRELGRALALEGEPDPGQAYAFLVDNNGLAYFHPKMFTPPADEFAVRRTLCHRISTLFRSNTRVPFSRADELVRQQLGYLDSIPSVDILELETEGREEELPEDGLLIRFRHNLVSRNCGQALEDAGRQFRCFPIRGTPLVAGFVLRKGRSKITLRENPKQPREDPSELAERLRSALDQQQVDAGTSHGSDSRGTNNTSQPIPPLLGLLLGDDQPRQFPLAAQLSRLRPLAHFSELLRLLPSVASEGAVSHFLAHLSAIGPDSLFPAWASRRPRDSGPLLCPRPSSSRSPLVASFLELRSSALVGWPSLVALFPRCELASVQSFLRLPLAARPDSAKLLRVHTDSERDGLLTVERPLGLLGGGKSLARVGVQMKGHYLHQKLQRAVQQPGEGWAECSTAAGRGGGRRKCLLLSADSFVLATSESPMGAGGNGTSAAAATFRPTHLSRSEPELFTELLNRGLIRKMSWRNANGLCPITPDSARQRLSLQGQSPAPGQQSTAGAHQQQESPASSSSSSSLFSSAFVSLFRLFLGWAANLMLWPVPVFASPPPPGWTVDHFVPLEPDCEVEPPQTELLEQCTLRQVQYRLRSRAREREGGDQQQPGTTALWLRERSCNRTIGLLPFARSELFLLLLEGECPPASPSAPAQGGRPTPSAILQVQVPNCNLTLESLSRHRRPRPDLDYSRSHPREFNPVCSNGIAQSRMPMGNWPHGAPVIFASTSLAIPLLMLIHTSPLFTIIANIPTIHFDLFFCKN